MERKGLAPRFQESKFIPFMILLLFLHRKFKGDLYSSLQSE